MLKVISRPVVLPANASTGTISPTIASGKAVAVPAGLPPYELPTACSAAAKGAVLVTDEPSGVSTATAKSKKAAKGSKGKGESTKEVQAELSPSTDVYDVEKIVAHRLHNGVYEYQVKWKNYKTKTWEPYSNFYRKKWITEYWRLHGGKASTSR